MDGAYVRDWVSKKTHFEVIVGKSVPWRSSNSSSKSFGFVGNYDAKPKRRLFEVLLSQGMQMNQSVTFVSDGADNLRDLQVYLNPHAEHVLDWFHIAMRLTVLGQYAKGVSRLQPEAGEKILEVLEVLERIKWYLWHGNLYEATRWIESTEWDAEGLAHELGESGSGQIPPSLKKLCKGIREFKTYIERNGGNTQLRRKAAIRRGHLHLLRRVDGECGRRQALQQAPADAVDAEGSASAAADSDQSLERRPRRGL